MPCVTTGDKLRCKAAVFSHHCLMPGLIARLPLRLISPPGQYPRAPYSLKSEQQS